MEFSRVGKHTIKCIISEQEILDLGYSLEDIMSNGAKTQEFMNHIFDLAEKKFETKFELGIKTVRADFMSDHTLSLTFSEHPGANEMAEHLKDIVSGLLDSITQTDGKFKEANKDAGTKKKDDFTMPEGVRIEVMFLFDDMETLIRFSQLLSITEMPKNALYKFEDTYFLLMDLSQTTETDVKRLSMLTDEYVADIVVGAEKRAFIEEHAEVILRQNAVESLKQL